MSALKKRDERLLHMKKYQLTLMQRKLQEAQRISKGRNKKDVLSKRREAEMHNMSEDKRERDQAITTLKKCLDIITMKNAQIKDV